MTIQDRLAPGKYKLRVEDYLLLDEAGVFGTARTELIEGDVIVMSPEFRPHGFIRDELTYRLRCALDALGSDLYAMGASVHLSEKNMPQPDIVLTAEPRGAGAIPLTSVALVVEVSAATLAHDLGRKAALYARAGVPEYWVIDVEARMIHQMWSPAREDYAERRLVPLGERIEAATVEGFAVATDGI